MTNFFLVWQAEPSCEKLKLCIGSRIICHLSLTSKLCDVKSSSHSSSDVLKAFVGLRNNRVSLSFYQGGGFFLTWKLFFDWQSFNVLRGILTVTPFCCEFHLIVFKKYIPNIGRWTWVENPGEGVAQIFPWGSRLSVQNCQGGPIFCVLLHFY